MTQTILSDCCGGGGGNYLFHEDENSDFNLGTKSLQCGRRVDSLKLWLSWKAGGNLGYRQKVEHLMGLKDHALALITENRHFKLMAPAVYLNVLFRFDPDRSLANAEIDQLNIAICNTLLRQDLGFVDYAHHKGKVGIRYILANREMDEAAVTQFLTHCENIGQQLSREIIS